MKRKIFEIYLILFSLLIYQEAFPQAPQSFPYQSVLRDSIGNLISNQNVSLRFSILNNGTNGTLIYQETHSAITNKLGLFDVNIGQGTVTNGTFSAINWGNGSKYLKIELDANGSNNYVVMDNAQLLSVPYALYANVPGVAGPQGPAGTSCPEHFVGETYGGGKVFYVYDGGQHGLIAALNDICTDCLGSSQYVSCGTGCTYPLQNTPARSNGIGAGFSNTLFLIDQNRRNLTNNGPSSANVSLQSNYAPYVAINYNSSQNGVTYGDWYLPSLYELSLLYQQRNVIGGFFLGTNICDDEGYLTSENPPNNFITVYSITFGNGTIHSNGCNGNATGYVRPIRRF